MGKFTSDKQKKDVNQRIATHIRENKFPIAKAMNKYGIESFVIEIIDYSDSREILNEKETYWIKFYNCKSPIGYNLTNGGDGIDGYSFSDSSKIKMKESHKGKVSPMRGKKYSEEVRLKMSKGQRGKKKSSVTRQRMSETKKGHPTSEETKTKISLGNKGKKISEETKKKIRETKAKLPSLKGIPRTEEAKQNMRHPHKKKNTAVETIGSYSVRA